MQNIPILLSGTITELKTLKGRTNFVMGAGMQAGAGAAAVGSFFSSSLLAQSALSLNEQAVFFTCVVNGIKLSGCFNTLPIREGETVELVIEPDRTRREGVVYAIRKPELRQLWVAPAMEKGHGSMARMCLGLPLIFLKYFLPFVTVFMFLVAYFTEGLAFIADAWGFMFYSLLIGGGLLMG